MAIARTHLPNEFTCPSCHVTVDACANMHGVHLPKDGDFSVCIACGELSQYRWVGGTVTLVLPDALDIIQAKMQPGFWDSLMEGQALIKSIIREQQKK